MPLYVTFLRGTHRESCTDPKGWEYPWRAKGMWPANQLRHTPVPAWLPRPPSLCTCAHMGASSRRPWATGFHPGDHGARGFLWGLLMANPGGGWTTLLSAVLYDGQLRTVCLEGRAVSGPLQVQWMLLLNMGVSGHRRRDTARAELCWAQGAVAKSWGGCGGQVIPVYSQNWESLTYFALFSPF